MQRVDNEPSQENRLNLGKVATRITYVRRQSGTDGGADGHRHTAAGEIGQREREHEQSRAIFAQLWISNDYSNQENVQRYVHNDH